MKKIISVVLVFALLLTIPMTAIAVEADVAAQNLNKLGLFSGVGNNADGTPNFELNRAPTRNEAITMLVRLLGKDSEAKSGSWTTPFTDVADWAKPYVGYAYTNGLTSGTSATTFGGEEIVSASQYLTFVLRALGYSSSTDFAWDRAWVLSDKLSITDGRYNASTTTFLRGDVASISFSALSAVHIGEEMPLFEVLMAGGVFSEVLAKNVGLITAPVVQPDAVTISAATASVKTGDNVTLTATVSPDDATDKTVKWTSSNASVATVSDTGVVSGKSVGSAVITATASNGKIATCNVSVLDRNSVVIDMPSVPVQLNKADYRGEIIESTVTVTDIKVNQTYYEYSNEVTIDILFAGTLDFSTRSGSTYGYIQWQLLDSDGYVVDSGDVMTSSIRVGQAFRDAKAIVFDLVPGEKYTLELVDEQGLSDEEMSVVVKTPSLPITIREYDYSGNTLQSTLVINDIRIEQEYSYGDVDIDIYFSGICEYNYSTTNTNRKIIWTLKDSNGNTVDSGQAYTPIVKTGDTFVDADDRIYNLKPGETYTLEISTGVK